MKGNLKLDFKRLMLSDAARTGEVMNSRIVKNFYWLRENVTLGHTFTTAYLWIFILTYFFFLLIYFPPLRAPRAMLFLRRSIIPSNSFLN